MMAWPEACRCSRFGPLLFDVSEESCQTVICFVCQEQNYKFVLYDRCYSSLFAKELLMVTD